MDVIRRSGTFKMIRKAFAPTKRVTHRKRKKSMAEKCDIVEVSIVYPLGGRDLAS